MRIDETGHQYAAAAIDRREMRITRLETFTWADRDDTAVADRNRSTRADAGVAHFRAAPCPRRTSARDDLRRVDEQERRRRFTIHDSLHEHDSRFDSRF